MKAILFILTLTLVIVGGMGSANAQSDRNIWQEWKTYFDNYKQIMEIKITEYQDKIKNLENTIISKDNEITQLKSDSLVMIERGDDFENEVNIIQSKYDRLYEHYEESYDYGNKLYEESVKPRTTIKETEINWDFYDSKGNFYTWSMPITTYEDFIEPSRKLSLYNQNTNYLTLNINDKTITTVNLEGFVLKSFENVIDQVYDNSENDSDFINEVWFIVSQLTVYDTDVRKDSEGRYALETFSRTGGDCEDLSILIIDMLKSSKHTKNWKIEIVYMDTDNPTKPKDVNHTVVYVNDGTYDYFIESTTSPGFDYYPDGVAGWYYDI